MYMSCSWYFASLSGLDYDIIDEALYFFKANIFFKNYEIKVRFSFFFVHVLCSLKVRYVYQ